MNRMALTLAAALLLPAAAIAEETPASSVHQSLIDTKAGSIVSVKMVISLSGTMGAQTLDREINNDSTGVVVDGSGLVMLPSADFSPRFNPRMRRMISNLKVTPLNIRVIFPGDEKEYDAILGAKDTKLGLGFVLVKDLQGRTAVPLDLAQRKAPAVGDVLYGVTRLGQEFDHAPICDEVRVVGELKKPRKAWLISRANNFRAHALFTADGAVAGLVYDQEGVGSDAGSRVCLLPLGIGASTIERSLKMARDALEEALEAEAEAEAAAKEAEAAKQDEAGKEGAGEGGDEKEGEGAKPDGDPKQEPAPKEPAPGGGV